jgi:hypothetical protein
MGGRAFDNVEPIRREHIAQITAWLITLFKTRVSPDSNEFHEFYLGLVSSVKGNHDDNLREFLVKNGMRYLGSTGKKDHSGDIDVAVSDTEWTYESLLEFLRSILPHEDVKGNGSLSQIYTRLAYYPVNLDGSMGSVKWVQIDFMVGDVELLEFTHWSPHYGTSMYSGSHRTELIKAVAKALSDWTMVIGADDQYNPGEMVGRLGYTLNHDKGLVHGGRFAPKRKDGKGYTKRMIPVTEDNLQEFIEDFFPTWLLWGWESRYSEAELVTKVSVDPKFIAQQLFGVGVLPEALNSYEQVVDAILANDELASNCDLIWQLFVERLVQIGQPIPGTSLNELHALCRSYRE